MIPQLQHMVVFLILFTLLRFSTSCPIKCECDDNNQSVNCTNVSSLKTLGSDVPPGLRILIVQGGSLHHVAETEFEDVPTKTIVILEITNTALQDVGTNSFTMFVSLKHLNLSHNQIQTIERDAFTGLKDLETLDLSHNYLQSPSSSNLLYPLRNLIHLDYSYNEIRSFPNQFFSQQSVLHKLNIGYNSISNLKGNAFKGARNLRILQADHCQISTMENDFLLAIGSVQHFDLSYNQLTSLPNNGVLTLLYDLRNFTLRGNGIVSLLSNQFGDLNLDNLDLSDNHLTSINPNAFHFIRGLRGLDLSNNSFQTLPSYLFQPIAQSLTYLKLSNNNIKEVPEQLLAGLLKLRELEVSNCGLKSLTNDHFRDLIRLKVIDVSDNKIQSVPQGFIDKININGMLVSLDNNEWVCDCGINSLRTWFQLYNWASRLYCKQSANDNSTCPLPRCVTPNHLQGREIISLTNQDLGECENSGAVASDETSVILGAVFGAIGGIILLIVVTIVVMCLYRMHKRGESCWCGCRYEDEYPSHETHRRTGREKILVKWNCKRDKHYQEKRERHNADPEIGSVNESDKSFMIRNYFHSMNKEPDEVSEITQSMTRKDSVESLSQSGYGYGSRRGSRQSSQYSLTAGYKIESAV